MKTRVARGLAAMAVVAWVYGVVRSTSVFRSNAGTSSDAVLLWALVPLVTITVAIWATREDRWTFLWMAVGAHWSFVVLAAWSLGTFFAWSALLLLVAAAVHVVDMCATWRAIAIPAWFLFGAIALCPILLAISQFSATLSGGSVTAAPIVVAGTWLFLGLALLLSVGVALQTRAVRMRR